MNTANSIKTIFFDYDGTLHDSMYIYKPAFIKAYNSLVELNLAKPKKWTEEEISKWIGYNPKEMWEVFMPDISQELREASSRIITDEMNRLIKLDYPRLYKGALETLKYLKNKKYSLVFISNCKKEYMENHNFNFKLMDYFDNMICSEDYGYVSKKEILSKIVPDYQREMVIVGDRRQDIEAGKSNNIMTIGCSYGFGSIEEIESADIIINNITDLKCIL